MAWVSSNKVINSNAKPTTVATATKAQPRSRSTLSMYHEAPSGEIALEEFERFALDRLKVLRGIEDLKVKGFRPDQMQEKIAALVEAHLKGATKEETHRKDIASHYIVRLGFSLTEDKRRWFLAQECDLFRARFKDLLPSDQRAFMDVHELPFASLSRDEFEDVRDALTATVLAVTNSPTQAQAVAQGSAAHEAYCKVPFELVPDLVSSRRCYLKAGFAYVSRDQVGSLVIQPFRAALSKAMVKLARDWNSFMAREEKDRLAPLVEGLSQRYLGPDYSDPSKRGAVGIISAADIPRLAHESFPLCMATMTAALHKDHHLKHTARQQLGLFLKGIGLPLEEAIRFWRTEMAQHAPGDKFDKEYLYNIRHNYGKEGKRQDYTPHSCASVIGTTPGVGQVHGCPYRLFGEDALRAALGRLQVDPSKAEEAVGKAKAGHFQLACASVWEGKMGCACDTGINHPNQYYEESRKALAEKAGIVLGEDGVAGVDAAAVSAGAMAVTPGDVGGAEAPQQEEEDGSGGAEGGPAKIRRVA